MKISKAWIIGLAIATVPATSDAFAPHEGLVEEQGFKAFDGAELRVHRQLGWTAPTTGRAADAWRAFEEAMPGWRGQWDRVTGVPARLFGPGLTVPGASDNPEAALAAARTLVRTHRDLLAPGTAEGDLTLAANHFDPVHRIRTVGFVQTYAGLPVQGGQISVRFKNDRLFVIGSEILPNVSVERPNAQTNVEALHDKALAAIGAIAGQVSLHKPAGAPMILPMVPPEGTIRYLVVREVVVESSNPYGRWSVYLDAETGAPIAREQTVLFASGTLQMNVPDRHPGGGRKAVGVPLAVVTAGPLDLTTGANGELTWPGEEPLTEAALFPVGTDVIVDNAQDTRAAFTFSISDGQTVVWDAQNDELVDAQLNTYIAGNVAWNYASAIATDSAWLSNSRLEATVNLPNTCNAFYDGDIVGFFRGSNRCENTGRLEDVVYHEFGHSFHANSIIRGAGSFDTPMSEGASDYFAATITNDSGMGRGFFYSNQPLRELNPADTERVWPDDVQGQNNPHGTGLIFGGTMWDLRARLMEDMTAAEAVRLSDQFLYATLQRARDIPTTYVEVLAADDDDGNIANGTPNFCAINEIFALHGLAESEVPGPPLGRPAINGAQVSIPTVPQSGSCPTAGISGIELYWQNRADTTEQGTVAFTQSATGWAADLPTPEDNTVVQYRITVNLDDGSRIVFPNNEADPLYEAYFGETTPLFCTDFEQDPFAAGWQSELVRGQNREGANDWQWGSPLGEGGDPDAAFSGTGVIGNDLGEDRFNGAYQRNVGNRIITPTIDTQGFEVVRLQYRRWLNVEDGDFDSAVIRANGTAVWSNFSTGNQGDTHHRDREWRFHDVDLSEAVAATSQVQLSFNIDSDGGLEFGGWTIDDLCVVGLTLTPEPVCGNGEVEQGETCDDGNTVDGDGCEADCTPTPRVPACGDGIVDEGEACDDGNLVDGDGCQADCTVTPEEIPMPPVDPCVADPASCELDTLEDAGCGCSAASHGSARSSGIFALLALVGAFWLRRRFRAL